MTEPPHNDQGTPALANDLLRGAKECAAYTGLAERAIFHMVENDAIPHFRMGKLIFLRKSELEAAFRSPRAA